MEKGRSRQGAKLGILAWLLAAIMMLGLFPGLEVRAEEVSLPGLGKVTEEWERSIYQASVLKHLATENEEGFQKTYTIDFKPDQANLKVVSTSGPSIYGGDIMSELVKAEEADGDKVVFGINGDGYDVSNGVPSGMMINNGYITTSANYNKAAIGFTKDGKAVYGTPNLKMNLTTPAGNIPVVHLNKDRKLDEQGVYLMTRDYGKTTQTNKAGVEVIVKVNNPDYAGIRLGEPLEGTVESVHKVLDNKDGNLTPIAEGTFVLSASDLSAQAGALEGLKPGDPVAFKAISENPKVDWASVEAAIGIFHLLVVDGVDQPALNDTAVHPRTSLGVRADGSVVLMENDGRQPGFAMGLTFREMADYLKSQGCIHVFNFDGGGSSTITATLPGFDTSVILNRPSDGRERANSNALLFVQKGKPNPPVAVEKLHIYPDLAKEFGSEVNLLEGGKMSFKVLATDQAYNTAQLDPAEVVYSVEGGIGTVSETGVLTAAMGTHEGKIIATSKSTGATGEIKIRVVDQITKLKPNVSIVSVAPGKTTKLSFQAESNGTTVMLSPEALTFSLSDPALGTMASDGSFTAGSVQMTGELTVSYKDYSFVLPVEIGKLPVALNDFEKPLEEVDWMWRYFPADGSRGGSGKASINYDERFVKTGDGSLRLDYDFASKPVTGTVALEVGPKPEARLLEGQPKAIGMWVYGDGNGAWLRIQLAPAAYVGSTYVDWKGWKYIETPIPATAKFPYELMWGVRLLCTPKLSANYKKGTIYCDGLRAVYDYKNDDLTPPALKPDTSITPADGATEVGKQPEISMTVVDPKVEGKPYTGINTSRTKLWINGVPQDNILQEVHPDGAVTVSYIPSAITQLRSGHNHIKYRVEDNAGNKFFKEWDFTVAGYNVNLYEIKPAGDKAMAGASFDYVIQAKDYKNFEEFSLELAYAPGFVDLIELQPDSRLQLVDKVIDEENGLVKLTLKGMKDLAVSEDSPLVRFTFKNQVQEGGQTGILVKQALVKETGEIAGTKLWLEGYDKEIEIPYALSYVGVTAGETTEISLKDKDGNPIAGGIVTALDSNGEKTELGVTDEAGMLMDDFLTSHPVGSKFTLSAVGSNGAVSNTTDFLVEGSLGKDEPAKFAVTLGEDPTSQAAITWETKTDVTSSSLKIGQGEDLSDGVEIPATAVRVKYIYNGQVRLVKRWTSQVYDLKPGTKYYYQVGQSSLNSFTTAQSDLDATAALFGDIQGGFDRFADTFAASRKTDESLELNIQVGDFSDGGDNYAEWEAIDQTMGSLMANHLWAPVLGNHDMARQALPFLSYFNTPDNGVGPKGRNYHYELGNAVIYTLDTQCSDYDPDFSLQLAKMKEVFQSSDKLFKVVAMHRSVYPQSYNEADVRALAEDFEDMGVDLVLSGHDHIYSRTTMKDGAKQELGEGVTYVVLGSSTGSKYYDPDSTGRPWTDVVYAEKNPMFSYLRTTATSLSLYSYALVAGESKLVDDFTIRYYPIHFEEAVVAGPKVLKPSATGSYTITVPEGQLFVKALVNGEEVATQVNEAGQRTFDIVKPQGPVTIEVVFKPIEPITHWDKSGQVAITELNDYLLEGWTLTLDESIYRRKKPAMFMYIFTPQFLDEEGRVCELDGSRSLTVRIKVPEEVLMDEFGVYINRGHEFTPLDHKIVEEDGVTYVEFRTKQLETFALGKYKPANKNWKPKKR